MLVLVEDVDAAKIGKGGSAVWGKRHGRNPTDDESVFWLRIIGIGLYQRVSKANLQ
jgi:hypothetical protein